jgi:hypothetical protein
MRVAIGDGGEIAKEPSILEEHAYRDTEFERAASLTRNARERELLLGRAAVCERDGARPR